MKKVIVAGHICVDITPIFPGEPVSRLDEILLPGRLVNMQGVSIHTGGATANAGLAMKKMGMDVRLMGKIGNDDFGKLILEVLARNGYDGTKDMIISDSVRTSYTVALAVPGIDRILLHDPGANDSFCCENMNIDDISQADLFHFGYPPLMRSMFINDGAELVKLYRKVKELGVATSLDMAVVDAASEAGKADWRKILQEVLPYVDFFVPSVEEICFMLDRDRLEEWTRRADGRDITLVLDPEKDIRPLADELMEMGAKIMMIKCGAPGLYFRTAGKERLTQIGKGASVDPQRWADLEWFEKSYRPRRVLSATAAGDISIAGFLTAILKGRSPQQCLHVASAAGSSCVEAYDALSGFEDFEELETKIAAGWEKQTLTEM